MNLICKIFGHSMPRKGWWGDGLYGRVRGGYHDGIGRTHYTVEQECPICGEWWITARFHGSQVSEVQEVKTAKAASIAVGGSHGR